MQPIFNFYGLRESPFGSTPNPRFLYLSRTHKEALASLVYGLTSERGFISLIAQPGLGKTALLLRVLEHLRHSARTVFVFQTQCNSRELLAYVLSGLSCNPHAESSGCMQESLNSVLREEMRNGRRVVVVIDEAQNLGEDVLETVRLLSNFETPEKKLLQIILSGQLELAQKLCLPSLSQLQQRIGISIRLEPLQFPETASYIDHRLRVSGYVGEGLFSPQALARVFSASQGIPRNINTICFNALSSAYALSRRTIDEEIIEEVMADLSLDPGQESERSTIPLASVAAEVPREGLAPRRIYVRRLPAQLALVALLAIVAVVTWALGHQIRRSRLRESVSIVLRTVHEAVVPATFTSSSKIVAMGLEDRSVPAHTEPAFRATTPPPFVTIVIQPNETLASISLGYFGAYRHDFIEHVRHLNPELIDPNHVEAGHSLRIPGSSASQSALVYPRKSQRPVPGAAEGSSP